MLEEIIAFFVLLLGLAVACVIRGEWSPSLIRAREAVPFDRNKPSLPFPLFPYILVRSVPVFQVFHFCPLVRGMVSIQISCTCRAHLTLLNIGDVKHTVFQIRLRRSLHRDTLFASRRKVSMGPYLYRPTRRRHTPTDPKTPLEANISS